jgi:hypothetical protein
MPASRSSRRPGGRPAANPPGTRRPLSRRRPKIDRDGSKKKPGGMRRRRRGNRRGETPGKRKASPDGASREDEPARRCPEPRLNVKSWGAAPPPDAAGRVQPDFKYSPFAPGFEGRRARTPPRNPAGLPRFQEMSAAAATVSAPPETTRRPAPRAGRNGPGTFPARFPSQGTQDTPSAEFPGPTPHLRHPKTSVPPPAAPPGTGPERIRTPPASRNPRLPRSFLHLFLPLLLPPPGAVPVPGFPSPQTVPFPRFRLPRARFMAGRAGLRPESLRLPALRTQNEAELSRLCWIFFQNMLTLSK